MKRIVVTGATGMIGSSLAKLALAEGAEVLCVARKSSSRLEAIPKSKNVRTVLADLSEYASLDLPADYDAFFHLAWDKTSGASRDDPDVQLRNVQHTLDAARLAKRLGCSAFVGAGSQAEYGIASEPLRSDTPADPRSGYGIAKYAAGKLAGPLCHRLGMRFNWMRTLSVFGPGDGEGSLIMYATRELQAGRAPELTKCEQTWDYLYCEDAARAFLAAGERGADGKAYPLGSGSPRKLSDYLESLRDIVNPAGALLFGRKDYCPHQPMRLRADMSELSADTGWKPEVSFEEGVRLMIERQPDAAGAADSRERRAGGKRNPA